MYMFGSYEAPFSPTHGAAWRDQDALQSAVNHHYQEARHMMTRAAQATGRASEIFEMEAKWHKQRCRELYALLTEDGEIREAEFSRFLREELADEDAPVPANGNGHAKALETA